MFINHHSKQVTAKIVYYGPGLSGKTTNLQYIFSVTNPKTRGELVSIETDIERTLFFDLLPINVGLVNGYQARFQLYTVPGQVFYDSTRQLVLKGADGIVFVADSQEVMENANVDSLENLKVNLAKHQQSIEELPVVFQFNKRDLKNTLPIERLNRRLNTIAAPSFGASAITGAGVIETLREISSMTLRKIKGLLAKTIQAQSLEAFVNFDTDRKQKIIKREELPLKKVSAAAKPAVDSPIKITVPVPAHAHAPTPAPPDEPQKKPQPVQPVQPLQPLQPPAKKNEESEEVLELTEFEQVVETKAAQKLEKTDEIPELKGFDEEEIEIELGDAPELNDLDNVFKLEESGQQKVDTRAPVPSGFYELGEVEETPIIKPVKTAVKEMEKTALEIDTEKVAELLKPPKKSKPEDLEFLEKLRDNSRLTILRKMVLLPGPDSSLVIELKDNKDKTSLLEPIDVKITPGVKKITLILDIK